MIEKESVFDELDLVKYGHRNLVEAERRYVHGDSDRKFQELFDDMKDYTEMTGEETGVILVGHSMGVSLAFERFIKLYIRNFSKDPELVVAIEGGKLDYGFWFRAYKGKLNSKNCHNYYQKMPMSLIKGSPLKSCYNQDLSGEVFSSMGVFHKSSYILSPFLTGALSSVYNHKTVASIAWKKSLPRMMELLDQR